jgi:hypothetical protein
MYKGCTRDAQGTNRLATPEQRRSNTGATRLQHAHRTLDTGIGEGKGAGEAGGFSAQSFGTQPLPGM